MHLPTLSTVLLSALSSVSAVQLAISLPSSHVAALKSSSIGTSAVLHSSPPIRVPLSHWGGFSIDLSEVAAKQNGSEERYLLDVYSKQYVFAPILLEVDKKGDVSGAWEVKRGETWKPGEGMRVVEVRGKSDGDVKSVTARVVATRDFYEERAGFSPLSLFKNPMILMAIAALGVTFGMPYLMENMDEETKAEFAEQQKKGVLGSLTGGGGSDVAAASNPANFDLAGWMAGQTSSPSASSAGTGKEGASGNDARKGDVRRRG